MMGEQGIVLSDLMPWRSINRELKTLEIYVLAHLLHQTDVKSNCDGILCPVVFQTVSCEKLCTNFCIEGEDFISNNTYIFHTSQINS